MKKREYTIDMTNPVDAARTQLQMFRDQLEDLRTSTPNPSELEWEIRLYDFMLEDPVTRLDQYKVARFKNGMPRPKRAVVQELGWVVP